jgi:hypothetical protein
MAAFGSNARLVGRFERSWSVSKPECFKAQGCDQKEGAD